MPDATMPARRFSAAHLVDLGAFLLGLGVAWALGWQTRDLVWSLWLSSLVVGYATLLLAIVFARPSDDSTTPAIITKVFVLLFFTVHFGGFHFVHSAFLAAFFPLTDDWTAIGSTYAVVFREYWPWLFAAAIAERHALLDAVLQRAKPPAGDRPTPLPFDTAGPYRNVVRMHLLIFVFAGLALAGIGGIGVYALVYAAYFWPRRGVSASR